jgi:hypothetical protein
MAQMVAHRLLARCGIAGHDGLDQHVGQGQAWGLKTIESFHTHGTPPTAGPDRP